MKRPPRSASIAIALAAAATPVAAHDFTVVVIDDFVIEDSRNTLFRGWSARIGSGGHVAYFSPDELRLWDGDATSVLHTIGDRLEGLTPDTTTTLTGGAIGLPAGIRGQILGVDRYGGVSAMLAATGVPVNEQRVVASTTLDGGFRAVMAVPELVAHPAVIASRPSIPLIGARRDDGGTTLIRDFLQETVFSGTSSFRTVSRDLNAVTIASAGMRTPDNIGKLEMPRSYNYSFNSPHSALRYDTAGGYSVYNYRFMPDDSADVFAAVARYFDGRHQVLVRSDTNINGIQLHYNPLFNPRHPLVRINAAGDVVMVGNFSLFGAQTTQALVYAPGPADEAGVIAEFNQPLILSNHSPIMYNPRHGSSSVAQELSIADDGSVLFRTTIPVPYASPGIPGIIRMDPSGEFSMLLVGDPDFLGVSQSLGFTNLMPTLSLDGTSAAARYSVGGNFTIFHAAPSRVTRVLGGGDTVELAPGDTRLVTDVRLLDVYAQRVLLSADFSDGSRAMLSTVIPNCRADLNNDGVVDADDFFTYLNLFSLGDPRADINNDGVIDADDFFAYLDLFAQGC